MTLHVTPLNDLLPHEECTTCNCEPNCLWQPGGDLIVVHSAYDGREALEEALQILNT